MINIAHVAKKPFVKEIKPLTFTEQFYIKYLVNGCDSANYYSIDPNIIIKALESINGQFFNEEVGIVFLGSDGLYYSKIKPSVAGNIEFIPSPTIFNQFLIYDNQGGLKPKFQPIQVNQITGQQINFNCAKSNPKGQI
jgi:hypothetical protein